MIHLEPRTHGPDVARHLAWHLVPWLDTKLTWHNDVTIDVITSSSLVRDSAYLWHLDQLQRDMWIDVELHINTGIRDPLHSSVDTCTLSIDSVDILLMSLAHAPYSIPLIHSQGKWFGTQSWNLSQQVIREEKGKERGLWELWWSRGPVSLMWRTPS